MIGGTALGSFTCSKWPFHRGSDSAGTGAACTIAGLDSSAVSRLSETSGARGGADGAATTLGEEAGGGEAGGVPLHEATSATKSATEQPQAT